MTSRGRRLGPALFVLLLLAVAACSHRATTSSTTRGAAAPTTVASGGGVSAEGGGGGAVPSASVGAAPVPAAPADTASPANPLAGLPDPGKVVRSGSMALDVSATLFGSSVDRLTALAIGANGYVADSKTDETGDRPNGIVTLKVPAPTFDQIVAQVRAIGRVVSFSASASDVTGEYADVQARLRALTATRDRYFVLMADASAIPDILALQDRIDGVQVQIEELQGRQKVLDNQTSFSTLAVSVAGLPDAGAPPVAVVAAVPPPMGWRLAWHRATRGFVVGVQAIVSASGVLAFAALIALVVGVVARPIWRRGAIRAGRTS